MISFKTQDAAQTRAFGEKLAEVLFPGSVVLLCGGLGTGKTELAKGIAQGLGIVDVVDSPTYTIVHVYSGRLPLYHFDLYRLKSYDELEMAGIDGYLFGNGVSLVEWPDIAEPYLNEGWIRVDIAREGGGREITVDAQGEAHIRALRGCRA